MKKYRYSIIYTVFLGVISYFHSQVARWITGVTGTNFAVYLIYALFVAFFAVTVGRAFLSKKNQDIAVALLSMALVFFILVTHPGFLFKLCVLEMFILGFILAMEGKKSNSLIPFILIAVAVVLAEAASSTAMNSHFYYLDAWRSSLIALSGYVCSG